IAIFPAQDLVKSGHLSLKIHTSGVQEYSVSFLATCTVIVEPLEAQVHISYWLHPVSNDS
ncbi:hypothetical protein SERLA73DRAFT_173775, partial [Serpula lacrymans var. lacrymans S7.3]